MEKVLVRLSLTIVLNGMMLAAALVYADVPERSSLLVDRPALANADEKGISSTSEPIILKRIPLDETSTYQRIWIDASGLTPSLWKMLRVSDMETNKTGSTVPTRSLPSPVAQGNSNTSRYRYSVSVPPEDTYLDAAVQASVEWLEIMGGASADQGEEDQRVYLKGVQEKILQRGLKVASIHLCPWYLKHDDAVNRMLLKNAISTMRIGRELFPGAIYVLHPGELIEDPAETQSMLAGCRQFVLDVGKAAEQLGVVVAVENLRKGDPTENNLPRVGQDMGWIREIVDQSPALGICLDTGHANISGDVCRMAAQAGDKLLIIHLSDNFGIYDNHLFPGEAKIPWNKLGPLIRDSRFRGILELEMNLPKEKDKMISVMKKSREFSRKTFE